MRQNTLATLCVSIAAASTIAMAQASWQLHAPDAAHVAEQITITLALDAERSASVKAIMVAAHERREEIRKSLGVPRSDADLMTVRRSLDAIHDQVRRDLAVVLTPEELERLDSMFPKRPLSSAR